VESIVDDLHASSLGVKGSSLFFNDLPETAALPCTAVRDMGGIPSHDRAPWLEVRFTIRGATWESARQHAARVFNHFHGATSKNITGYRILAAVATSMPAALGEDLNRRHLCGFSMKFRASANDQTAENVGFGGKRDPNG
jgi:hypothetical protein